MKKLLETELSKHAVMLQHIAEETIKLAQPVDLNELERKGVLMKSGAWYIVNDYEKVPDPAKARISEMKQEKGGRIKVKFKKTSDFDRIAKKFQKLGF